MTISATKRSVMTLFSGYSDIHSHRVRIVLAEKGVTVDILEMDPEKNPDELPDLNPYNTVPTLVDRDLVLYQSNVIMEYLDERFPHPPLLPVYPVARAKARQMVYRIDRDWYSLLNEILHGKQADADEARIELTESLTSIASVFNDFPYFLSEEFSLMDCCLGPLLWRLPLLGIKLPKAAEAVMDYGKRVFERESFQVSLTETEREIQD